MNGWNDSLLTFARTIAFEAGRLVIHVATAEGRRRPLDWVEDWVFFGIKSELEDMGISQKVAADMLGISIRTYQRRCERIEHLTASRHTLWQIIHTKMGPQTRLEDVLSWFPGRHDDEIRGVVRDMLDSGWLTTNGQHYAAVEIQAEWTPEMIRHHVLARHIDGNIPTPELLAQDTGVPEEVWRAALRAKEKASPQPIAEGFEEVAQTRMAFHRTQLRHLSRFIRTEEGMGGSTWLFPWPSKEHGIRREVEEKIEAFLTYRREFFASLHAQLNAHFAGVLEQDVDQWFIWFHVHGPVSAKDLHTKG